MRNWKIPIEKSTGNQVKCIYRWQNENDYNLIDPWEFMSTLEIFDRSYNNSTINIHLRDTNGMQYIASDSLLYQALDEKRIAGNTITGTFYFRKIGTMVLLQLKPLN